MLTSQFKLLVLCAAIHALPSAYANCSPYLKDGPGETSPEPQKCWTCAKPNAGFAAQSYQPFPDNEDDGSKSWWRFYCKYTRSEGLDDKGTPYKSSTIFCPYDVDGNLRGKDAYCPDKANKVPNCEPVRPYSGKSETCCGPNCQLQSDQCIFCPPEKDAKYVDVTVNQNILTCTYNWWSNSHRDVSYDAQTGAPLTAPGSSASRREGCKPKPMSAPGVDCATGATHDQCVKEATQDAYRSFVTWNRCASLADYCKYRSMSDDCWACPTIEGTAAVYEQDMGRAPGVCRYYKRNSSGILESANTECGYNLGSDGGRNLRYDGKNNAFACPSQAEKDLTCQRLKGGQ